jgi:hypothetical protein
MLDEREIFEAEAEADLKIKRTRVANALATFTIEDLLQPVAEIEEQQGQLIPPHETAPANKETTSALDVLRSSRECRSGPR